MANEIALQSEERKHPLDENLRPLKIGNKTAPLELSDTDVKVNNLQVSGTSSGVSDDTKLPLAGGTMTGDITTDSNIVSTDLTIDDSGTIALDSVDGVTKLQLNGDADDLCTITVAANGETTIATADSDGVAGHLNLDVDGDLQIDADGGDITFSNDGTLVGEISLDTVGSAQGEKFLALKSSTAIYNSLVLKSQSSTGAIYLDSKNGRFVMQEDGTEFSVANSAYAGMILGYTRIQNNGTGSSNNILTINSSAMTVLQTDQGTDFSIQFIVPPSGNVEIQCSFWMGGSSRGAKFSLSTDPSYAELGITHTYDADQTVYIDETDHDITNISFAVTGLTAGTDTTYYLAGLASSSNLYINHGRFRLTGSHYPPIILKAIALPGTITTGE